MDIKKIFDRSNELICKDIESYFPGGKIDNRGWYQLKNFDRGDKKGGSFGICVSGKTPGLVNDFADTSYKTNATAFYASVNGMNNTESAKKIIKDCDLNFYNKAWPPKNKVKYKPILPIPEDIYESDFNEYCSGDNRLSNNIDWIYEYRNIQNKLLYVSVRLKTPFTDKSGNKRKVLTVGYFDHEKDGTKWKDFTWYKNPFTGKAFPFSKQNELANIGKRNVLLVEGEKAAHFLESVLDSEKWLIITIGSSSYLYNSESYEIFKKLGIKHIFYWPDNDDAGFKTIGFVKERFDKVSVVKIPDTEYYVSGWDGADAVQDGWNSEDIEKFIFQNLYESEEIDPQYFKAISHDHENFYFMAYRLGLVKTINQNTITTGFLRIMAPLEYWLNKYPDSNKENAYTYNSTLAMEDIVTMGISTPYHETGRIRQIGAWEDDGRYVFHYGEGLIVDGIKKNLFEFETNNIYEKKGYLNFLQTEEACNFMKIAEIIKRFAIPVKQEKYLFIGWILMSLIGGALKWRPHIWLTGESGSGKSSAIDFIKMILGNSILKETGSSTEAGIRQRLKVSTLPVLIDELENMDDKTNKNLKAIKALIRQASSGARVSKGTTDHSGIDFAIQSMFCVGSISPQIAEKADLTRFAIINFDKNAQTGPVEWQKTESMMIDYLTPDYLDNMKGLLIKNIKKISENIHESFSVFSDLGYESRLSQQYSVLTVGAYICVKNGFDFDIEEYKEFVSTTFNFSDQVDSGSSTESEYCMSLVMQKVIDHRDESNFHDKSSIFELLKLYKKELNKESTTIPDNPDERLMKNISKAVKPYGFLLDHDLCEEDILFVYNSKYVKELLENTQFSGDIKMILHRHPMKTGMVTKTVYAGSRGSAIRFSYDLINDKYNEIDESELSDDNIPF